MIEISWLVRMSETVLAVPFVVILLVGIYLTIKTKFIQIRMIPHMIRLFINALRAGKSTMVSGSLLPHKALFAAMSTTIGIGNIVGPAVAVRLGGPGALVGFLMAIFFGAATTYAEVAYGMLYRKKNADGSYSGGPMYYIQAALGNSVALIYAFAGALLLAVWCSNQSNTLADVLVSYSIPKYSTGLFVASIVVTYLILGVRYIGNLTDKIVPVMFFLYCGAALWVIGCNASLLPSIFVLIVKSAFSLEATSGAAVGLAIQRMLRWGLAKGTQACEAGIGTATILHSQAEGNSPAAQAVLSMISAYSVAFVCTLSALVTLVSGTWNDASVSLGIAMIAQPLAHYFVGGKLVLALSAFLFGFGTILGNAYNGSKCFGYLTNNVTWLLYGYYAVIALVVFFGAVLDPQFVWTISDFFIIPVALPNILGIMCLVYRDATVLKND